MTGPGNKPGRRRVTLPTMKLRAAAVPCVLLAAAACGGSTPSSSMPSQAPPPPPGVAQLATSSGDIDGRPDREVLSVYADGTVLAGGWQGKVDVPAASDYFVHEQSKISAEVLDRAKGVRVVVVALPTEGEEDPPNRFQLLTPRAGGLVRIYDAVIGNYGSPELRFPGDGTVRYTEDGWTACHDQGDGSAPVHEVTLALDGAGMLVERGRAPTGETQDCSQLAACPWIYVDGPAGLTRVGEILRDVRGQAAYTLQDLALPTAAAGPLRVRVAEEEDEVTFLDEIYVEVDGLHLAPTACAAAAPPAYCVADHQPLRLRKGDVLDLTFDLPAASTPTVFARGYYVPTPSRAGR